MYKYNPRNFTKRNANLLVANYHKYLIYNGGTLPCISVEQYFMNVLFSVKQIIRSMSSEGYFPVTMP
jgi:hypothetical protein